MTKIPTPESSTIASIDHDGNNKLTVEFKSGGTYHYDAPASVFEQMKASPSKGKFHRSDIKGKFAFTKAVIAFILTAIATSAYAGIDYNCVARCERQGNLAQVCYAQCSY